MIKQGHMIPMEIIKELLSDRNLKVVAERTGIAYSTIRNAMNGSENTTIWTVIRLSDYLVRQTNMVVTGKVDEIRYEPQQIED